MNIEQILNAKYQWHVGETMHTNVEPFTLTGLIRSTNIGSMRHVEAALTLGMFTDCKMLVKASEKQLVSTKKLRPDYESNVKHQDAIASMMRTVEFKSGSPLSVVASVFADKPLYAMSDGGNYVALDARYVKLFKKLHPNGVICYVDQYKVKLLDKPSGDCIGLIATVAHNEKSLKTLALSAIDKPLPTIEEFYVPCDGDIIEGKESSYGGYKRTEFSKLCKGEKENWMIPKVTIQSRKVDDLWEVSFRDVLNTTILVCSKAEAKELAKEVLRFAHGVEWYETAGSHCIKFVRKDGK